MIDDPICFTALKRELELPSEMSPDLFVSWAQSLRRAGPSDTVSTALSEAAGLGMSTTEDTLVQWIEATVVDVASQRDTIVTALEDLASLSRGVASALGTSDREGGALIGRVRSQRKALEVALSTSYQMCGLACDLTGVDATTVRQAAADRRPRDD